MTFRKVLRKLGIAPRKNTFTALSAFHKVRKDLKVVLEEQAEDLQAAEERIDMARLDKGVAEFEIERASKALKKVEGLL